MKNVDWNSDKEHIINQLVSIQAMVEKLDNKFDRLKDDYIHELRKDLDDKIQTNQIKIATMQGKVMAIGFIAGLVPSLLALFLKG